MGGPADVSSAELPNTGDGRPAAVLCLLFEDGGEANVVLTRRARHLRDHAGEVSFPGGRLNPGEAPLAAALREAGEEVGVSPGSVTVLGELTPLTTRRSPALVRCFVGCYPGPGGGGFRLNDEVEKVICLPLATLAAPGVYHQELWPPNDEEPPSLAASGVLRAVPFFELDDDIVWGATGRLLVELLGVVLGVVGHGPAERGTLDR